MYDAYSDSERAVNYLEMRLDKLEKRIIMLEFALALSQAEQTAKLKTSNEEIEEIAGKLLKIIKDGMLP